MAIAQIQGYAPPQQIEINGISYVLKKSAFDSTSSFPIQRVGWINAGCDRVPVGAYCCWIVGIIAPMPNTLEQPISVVAIGFSDKFVQMHPNFIRPEELLCMNYYVCDGQPFIQQFANKYLGYEPATTAANSNESRISPFPKQMAQADSSAQQEQSEPVRVAVRQSNGASANVNAQQGAGIA